MGTALAVDEVEKLELPLFFIITKNDLIRLVPRHLLQPEKAFLGNENPKFGKVQQKSPKRE